MKSFPRLPIWFGTLLAAAGFTAALFSLGELLRQRGCHAAGILLDGVGGMIVLYGVPAVGAYFLSRGVHGAMGKWCVAIPAYLLILLVQAVAILGALCMLGNCL